MKAPTLLIAFISSFSALAALPWSIELAISPLVVTGLLVILSADYGTRRASLTRVANGGKSPERLPLAA